MWEYSPHPKIHKDGEQEFKQDFGRTGFIGAGHCSVTDNVTLIIISTIDRALIKKKKQLIIKKYSLSSNTSL